MAAPLPTACSLSRAALLADLCAIPRTLCAHPMQATYDRLGLDPGDPSWGYATVPADQLIAYLTQDYPLAPNAKKDEATPLGTKDM
jgi:hypothetical protein